MTDYTRLEQMVESHSGVILDMADRIWDWAELGFKEQKSSAYEAVVLEKNKDWSGGVMDGKARHNYECCIHGAMAPFGIKEPGV